MTGAPVSTRVGDAGVLSCTGTRGGAGVGHVAAPAPHLPRGPRVWVWEGLPHREARGTGPPTPGRPAASPTPAAGDQRTPLAVLARVAVGAGAVVLVGLGVDARAPVDTRVVAATVVEVWGQRRVLRGPPAPPPPTFPMGRRALAPPAAATFVTEQAAPVGLTVALPGVHAAAVHTAGVRDTLVTEPPLPAVAAPAGGQEREAGRGGSRLAPDAGAECHGPAQGWRPQPLKRSRPRARRG